MTMNLMPNEGTEYKHKLEYKERMINHIRLTEVKRKKKQL